MNKNLVEQSGSDWFDGSVVVNYRTSTRGAHRRPSTIYYDSRVFTFSRVTHL